MLHALFQQYGNTGTKIGELQAVNLTAIVGAKGADVSSREHAPDLTERLQLLSCANAHTGTNIISATFFPARAHLRCEPRADSFECFAATAGAGSRMYVAFEDGRGTKHVPAACQPYVKLDMDQWWA